VNHPQAPTEAPIEAVTFDAGQTLIDLDVDMLAARLAEQGALVSAAALAAAAPQAWQQYDAAVSGGAGHPWRVLMAALLAHAGLDDVAQRTAIVEWLWHEQPQHNLWRRKIPGMFELAAALRRAGVAVAVLSNSEGRLAELFAEQGWAEDFAVITDSGRLGIEKPDPRIFHATLSHLGVAPAAAVHVGDSWPADVEGALGAGLRAIWFGRHATAGGRGGGEFGGELAGASGAARVGRASDAREVAAILAGWGVAL
jgi:FMN hydrolase / 5-amino-6-(5-phospho-D-ribitylamino)uracil phosphatase